MSQYENEKSDVVEGYAGAPVIGNGYDAEKGGDFTTTAVQPTLLVDEPRE